MNIPTNLAKLVGLSPSPIEGDSHVKYRDFPLAALPTIIRESVVEVARNCQAREAMSAMIHLGASALAAQERHCVAIGDQRKPLSLFVLISAPSGERKSTVEGSVFSVSERFDRVATKELAAALKAFKQASRKGEDADPPPDKRRLIGGDSTIEGVINRLCSGALSACLLSDEAGQFLGGHSLKSERAASHLGSLTKLFDSGRVQRSRSKSNHDPDINFSGRFLTMVLQGQPKVMQETLSDPLFRAQGFLARCLFAAIPKLKRVNKHGYRSVTGTTPKLDAFNDRLSELMSRPLNYDDDLGGLVLPELLIDDDAHIYAAEQINELTEQSAAGEILSSDDFAPFVGRTPELALRIAGVLAVIEGADSINTDLMARGWKIARWSLMNWLAQFETAPANKTVNDCRELLDWLVKQIEQGKSQWVEFTPSQFNQFGAKRFRPKNKHKQLFKMLETHNWLVVTDDGNYRIAPDILNEYREIYGED